MVLLVVQHEASVGSSVGASVRDRAVSVQEPTRGLFSHTRVDVEDIGCSKRAIIGT